MDLVRGSAAAQELREFRMDGALDRITRATRRTEDRRRRGDVYDPVYGRGFSIYRRSASDIQCKAVKRLDGRPGDYSSDSSMEDELVVRVRKLKPSLQLVQGSWAWQKLLDIGMSNGQADMDMGRHNRIQQRRDAWKEIKADPVTYRRRSRRPAVAFAAPLVFNYPRKLLEEALEHYRGPYGPVARVNEPVAFADCDCGAEGRGQPNTGAWEWHQVWLTYAWKLSQTRGVDRMIVYKAL